MESYENDFLCDVLNAVDDYDFSYSSYHEDGGFIVEITFDDDEEWAENEEDIWDSLEEVADDWDACLDAQGQTYYVSIEADE